MSRIDDAAKPGLLTVREVVALPEIGVPSYYYGTNCLHSAITECAGERCPTPFPAAPNWQATFHAGTMEAMAAASVVRPAGRRQPHRLLRGSCCC